MSFNMSLGSEIEKMKQGWEKRRDQDRDGSFCHSRQAHLDIRVDGREHGCVIDTDPLVLEANTLSPYKVHSNITNVHVIKHKF